MMLVLIGRGINRARRGRRDVVIVNRMGRIRGIVMGAIVRRLGVGMGIDLVFRRRLMGDERVGWT